jgi:hypothetical protein
MPNSINSLARSIWARRALVNHKRYGKERKKRQKINIKIKLVFIDVKKNWLETIFNRYVIILLLRYGNFSEARTNQVDEGNQQEKQTSVKQIRVQTEVSPFVTYRFHALLLLFLFYWFSLCLIRALDLLTLVICGIDS